jgi:hypothetical protein
MIPAIVSPRIAPIIVQMIASVLDLLEFEAEGEPELFGGDEPDNGEEAP